MANYSMVVSSEKLWAQNDEFEGIDVSKINGEFLMSLMEELQDHYVEESDDERLNSMIQSLEAEIINSSIAVDSDQDSNMECFDHQSTSDGEESSDQSSSLGQMYGCDLSTSFDDLDMSEWIDSDTLTCSPSNDSINWYEMGYALDDQELGYNSLWQENCHLVQ